MIVIHLETEMCFPKLPTVSGFKGVTFLKSLASRQNMSDSDSENERYSWVLEKIVAEPDSLPSLE